MTMTKLSCLGAVAIAAVSVLAVEFGSTPAFAKVLAKVNGTEITDEDVKLATEVHSARLPQQLEGKARETYILDLLIERQLVAQKGKADKVDQTPEFGKKLAYFRDDLLIDTVLGQVAKNAVTDAKLHAAYDELKAAQKPETEVHARHILVNDEAEAKAALKRVKSGEDFAKVAKEVSKDKVAEGGDLDWFTRGRMVPEFADAAFKLEPGQISEPVKSPFGWHIIKLEGKRDTTFPPFDEVKDEVSRYVVQKAQGELVTKLRSEAKIERTEPPAPPPGEAPKGDAGKGEPKK